MWRSNGIEIMRAAEDGQGNSLSAIWAEVFSIRAARLFHCSVLMLIAGLVLLLPDGAAGEQATDLALSLALPDARLMARESAFPLVLAIAYSVAYIAPFFGGAFMCLTRCRVDALRSLVAGRPLLTRTLVVGALLVLNLSPMVEQHPVPIQVSWHVVQAIEQDRWALLVLCEAIYLVCTGSMTCILYEITNAVTAIFRRDPHVRRHDVHDHSSKQHANRDQ